jgi:GH15 family glucan-1,4-alpha-glucosidase
VSTPKPQPSKIQDYGIIGDCRSAALISRRGSLDWLCWPRFDSPSIFAALLDPEQGGSWSIAPTEDYEAERSYIENTNVLETRFKCPDGDATLTDLMPVASEEHKRNFLWPGHELLRELRCTRGHVEIEILFRPRAKFGRSPVRMKAVHGLGLRMEVGRGAYWLRSSAPLTIQDGEARLAIGLKQGEALQFSFSYAEESPAVLPLLGEDVARRIQRSIAWWREWSGRCTYQGPYRRQMVRSALALKLLAYAPSGAVIAAVTTSLPEILGGDQNWDYRYCWLRDASFTIRSLLGLGYKEEAESFIDWLLLATRITQPELRVLYNLYGGIAPRERCLQHLRGYFDSRPVRIGNDAREQLQLDVYGEVIHSAAQYARDGGEIDRTMQTTLIRFGKELAGRWMLPDEGIWEPRTGKKHHTFSRLMCWTAFDCLIELAEEGTLTGAPLELFRRERERIRHEIHSRAWNQRLQSYVSVLDGDGVDATLLLMPWYGFEAADSERMRRTYERVCRELDAGDGLLYRYRRTPPEGAFGISSFWMVEYLALNGGTLAQAQQQFEGALKYQNDLGLFSEEISPGSADALGNFPQAYTHVGVISAALTLQEQAHPMRVSPRAA